MLIDPAATRTVDRESTQSRSRNNPWHGRELTGAVVTTILRGTPTYLDGQISELETLA